MSGATEAARIILTHPGKQHSFRLAKALKQAGLLYRYITTVYRKEHSLLHALLETALSDDNRRRARGRRCAALDDGEVVQFDDLWGLLLLLAYRLDSSGRVSNRLKHRISLDFQEKVARYAIDHQADAVIAYDTNAALCFERLRQNAPHIKRILDSAHPARNYLHKIYNEKMAASGEFAKTYEKHRYINSWEEGENARLEMLSAQYHIVASSFSRDALKYCGIAEENIFLAPYGVDASIFVPGQKEYGRLNVLFVGEINQRKGIAQVLGAAKTLHCENIDFHLVGGGGEYCAELYRPYEPYARFHGRVPFAELTRLFAQAGIFVFPSMGEGFGLVILEALSAGLPVICSANCAGRDVIQDGYNGFVIEAGDTDALIDKIRWFNRHKELLPIMSRQARSTALEFTWEKYERKIADCMAEILRR